MHREAGKEKDQEGLFACWCHCDSRVFKYERRRDKVERERE